MSKTRDSTSVELQVAHAALTYIEAKGLTDEFYKTWGQCCNDKCMHAPDFFALPNQEG